MENDIVKFLAFVIGLASGIFTIAGPFLSKKWQKVASGLLCAMISITMAVRVPMVANLLVVALLFAVGWRVVKLENMVKNLQTKNEDERLRSLLIHIQRRAYQYLQATEPSLQDRQIRANVFLPHHSQTKGGTILSMHPSWQVNMWHLPENNIEFLPGQGATGLAFSDEYGRVRIARRLSPDAGEWEQEYQMTDELRDKVHEDLKWVMSFPLKDAQGNTIGVLNVDGLDYEFSDEQLSIVAKELLPGNIKAFGFQLATVCKT